MALFQFRKGRDEQAAAVAPPQTVEAVRRRAVHRLIGAAVLVLAGVIGFPLIFDNQPRPIPVDLPINIVDRNKVAPLVLPAPVTSEPTPAAATAPDARAQDAKKARALLEGKSAAPRIEPKVAADETSSQPVPKESKAAASEQRLVVQVGAFADQAKVREVRRKVEAAGLKTYTQVVTTPDGDRTRVRVGPFSDDAQAQQAADTLRKLGLAVAILSL